MSLKPTSSLGLAAMVFQSSRGRIRCDPQPPRMRQNGADGRVGEGGVEIGGAVLVGAGEIAEAVLPVRPRDRHQPHGGDRLDHQLEVDLIGVEARRRDDRDAVAGAQARGLATGGSGKGGQGHAQGQARRAEDRKGFASLHRRHGRRR